MSFEHTQIRDVVRALATARTALHEDPSTQRVMAVRGGLFALDAMLRAHMAREERFLIPLLDAEPAGR
jgi:hypothetical protein